MTSVTDFVQPPMQPPRGALPPAYILEGTTDTWQNWRKTAALTKHLAMRHLAQRYRGSSLGFLWSLLNPVLMTCIYSFVFKVVFRSEVPGVRSYTSYFLTGYLCWNFFSVAIFNAAASVAEGGHLINKCYFPRVVLPLSAILSSLMNYLMALPVLIVYNLIAGIWPGWSLLGLPVALGLTLLVAVGVGLLIASLAPFFRDLLQVLEVIFMAWFFATPIFYASSFIQDTFVQKGWSPALLIFLKFNPMVGAVEAMHAVFLGPAISWSSVWSEVWIAFVIGLALLALGWHCFSHMADRFGDVS